MIPGPLAAQRVERIGDATLYLGDCRDAMRGMHECGERVHAVVTDPPYHLTSITRRVGGDDAKPIVSNGATGVYARSTNGFMGKRWDGGDIAFRSETWQLRGDLLLPGGHLVAFGGTRTFHRMAVAIEDAGFEIRDTLMWLYGTGFPKSHDVSKGIDKVLGAVGSFGGPRSAKHAGWIKLGRMRGGEGYAGWQRPYMDDPAAVDNTARQYLPGSPEAARWSGWGTALKPAWEPIILARKPLAGTVARNVLQHGVGAINVDGCRVPASGRPLIESRAGKSVGVFGDGLNNSRAAGQTDLGRWPANVLHDGSDEVEAAFPDAPGQQAPLRGHARERQGNAFGRMGPAADHAPRGDSGSTSRFFYCAKATKSDRAGSKHPTVKPVALMRWLVRLVTPPGGVVLDPFAGSGTTGAAALAEGMRVVLIEAEPEYQEDVKRRLGARLPQDDLSPTVQSAAAAQQMVLL